MNKTILVFFLFFSCISFASADVQTMTDPIWSDISSSATLAPWSDTPLDSAKIFLSSSSTVTAEEYCIALWDIMSQTGFYVWWNYVTSSGATDVVIVSDLNPTLWLATPLDWEWYATSIDCDLTASTSTGSTSTGTVVNVTVENGWNFPIFNTLEDAKYACQWVWVVGILMIFYTFLSFIFSLWKKRFF